MGQTLLGRRIHTRYVIGVYRGYGFQKGIYGHLRILANRDGTYTPTAERIVCADTGTPRIRPARYCLIEDYDATCRLGIYAKTRIIKFDETGYIWFSQYVTTLRQRSSVAIYCEARM